MRLRLREVETGDFLLVKRVIENSCGIFELQVCRVTQISEESDDTVEIQAAIYGCKNTGAAIHERLFAPIVNYKDSSGSDRVAITAHRAEDRVVRTVREAEVHFGPWKRRTPRAKQDGSGTDKAPRLLPDETTLPCELADLWHTVGRPRAVIPITTRQAVRPESSHRSKKEGGESQDAVLRDTQPVTGEAGAVSTCAACRGRKRKHTCEKGSK